MRLLAIVVIMLAALQGVIGQAGANAQGDGSAAAQTAVELFYLESIGDFNTLYDRIHPDAHAIIPRAAVIGWYQSEFWPLGPGVATVTNVRIVSWTWPVNGQTHSSTAEVSFAQPFANGTVLEDVVRLVKDDSGQWRWFFGRSREFVEEQIARHVPQAPAVGGGVTIVDWVATDLNAFWGVSFAAAGIGYVPPLVMPVVPDSYSGCGYVGYNAGPAFYCAADQTIYFDALVFAELEIVIGDFAWITIMAHEWGHHVQVQRGIVPTPGPMFELQADCLAGSYARDAETRGLLDSGDVTEAVAVSAASGDAPWLPRDDYGVHGTGDERVTAFMRGYLGGFIGCGFPGSGGTTTSVQPPPAPATDLGALLPRTGEVPAGLVHIGDTQRSLGEVAVNYTDPAETERLFRSWGWEGNETRTFEGRGTQGEVTLVYVSIHRFADASGAANAMHYSLDDQAASTGGWEIVVSSMGESTRALQTSGDVTIYVQQDDVMIRLTVAGSPDIALVTADRIMQMMVGRV